MARLRTFIGRNFLRTKHKRPSRATNKIIKVYESPKR